MAEPINLQGKKREKKNHYNDLRSDIDFGDAYPLLMCYRDDIGVVGLVACDNGDLLFIKSPEIEDVLDSEGRLLDNCYFENYLKLDVGERHKKAISDFINSVPDVNIEAYGMDSLEITLDNDE
jgi:hypothetical protein